MQRLDLAAVPRIRRPWECGAPASRGCAACQRLQTWSVWSVIVLIGATLPRYSSVIRNIYVYETSLYSVHTCVPK